MLGINYVTVGQGDTAAMAETGSGVPEQAAMAEVPPGQTNETEKVNGDSDAPPAAQEGEVMQAAEQTTSSSAAPQTDLGFKKVFKLGGFKFTLKKDREEPPESVTLLTVKDTDGEGNGDFNGKVEEAQSKQQVVENGADVAAVQDPDQKSGEEAVASSNENDTDDQKGVHENGTKESAEEAVASESPVGGFTAHVTTPLRKMFNNRLFAGLRRKSSKAEKDDKNHRPGNELLVESTPALVNAEPAVEVNDLLPQAEEKQPCAGALPSEKSADATKENVLAAIDKVTEALQKQTTDINDVEVAQEDAAVAICKSEQSAAVLEERAEMCGQEIKLNEAAKQENVNSELVECSATVAENSHPIVQEAGVVETSAPSATSELTQDNVDMRTDPKVSPDGLPVQTSKAEETEQDLTSPDKSKTPSSPLKKFFMGGPLKKLSLKRGKEKEKSECKAQTEVNEQKPDETEATTSHAYNQTASPSGIEIESQVPQSPTQPEAADPSEEAEGVAEKKRDGITPWSSFKKLVKPRRRAKNNSESDKEEEPEEAGKTTTMSSTTSGVSGGKDASLNSQVDEHIKEDGGKKKTEHLGPNWEALICIGSSKKRGRKSSDSDSSLQDLQKQKDEAPAQGDSKPESATEHDQQFEDINLEVISKTVANKEERLPEKDDVQSEQPKAEIAEAPKNTVNWGSLKRLVTPKKRNKSKDHDAQQGEKEDAENLENENGQLQKTTTLEENSSPPSTSTSHHQESSHGGTHSSWSLKRFIPGKKKSTKVLADEVESATRAAEVTGNDGTADTPAVVPLAEYDDEEQPQVIVTDAAANSGEALSCVQIGALSDKAADCANVQGMVTDAMVDVGADDNDVNVEVGAGKVDCAVLQTDVLKMVEVGDETSHSRAPEVVDPEQRAVCAEESIVVGSKTVTQTTTENVDSTIQLTSTSNLVVSCSSEVSTTNNTVSSVTCSISEEISTDSQTVISETSTFTSVVSEEMVVITSSSIQAPPELLDTVESLNEEQKSVEEQPVVMQLPVQAVEPEQTSDIEQSQASSMQNVVERPTQDCHGDVSSDVFVAHQLEQIPEDVNEFSQAERKGEIIVAAAAHAGGAGDDIAMLIQKAVRAVVGGAEHEGQCGELEQGLSETETPPCDYATAAASVVEAAIEAATAFVKEHTHVYEAEDSAAVEVDLQEDESHPLPEANVESVISTESAQVDASQGASQELKGIGQLESKEVGADEKVQNLSDGHRNEAEDLQEEQEFVSERVTDEEEEQVVHSVENGFAATLAEEMQKDLVRDGESVAQVVSSGEACSDFQEGKDEAAVDEHEQVINEPIACEQEVLENYVNANKDSMDEVDPLKLEASLCNSLTEGVVEFDREAVIIDGNVNPPEELFEELSKQTNVMETIQEKPSKKSASFDSEELHRAEPTVLASQMPAQETTEAPAAEPTGAL